MNECYHLMVFVYKNAGDRCPSCGAIYNRESGEWELPLATELVQ